MSGRFRKSRQGVVAIYFAAALFLFAFWGYARSQSEAARAYQLYEQGRLAAAGKTLQSARTFFPSARWRGMRLTEVAARLNQAIQAVEQRAARRLPVGATDRERLDRARDLAMLERGDEALGVLDGSVTLAADAEACNLRGTIYETRGAFLAARGWYERAKAKCQRGGGSQQQASLMTALKGIAYCERKLGRLPAAEAGYQELLSAAPTADAHFLVAQFYEDTQQARRSHKHARQAMLLDPARYAEPGRRLVDKLMTSHFGCFSIASE